MATPPSPLPAGTQLARTVLFWLLMVVLAIVLWKMSGTGREETVESSYSDFQKHVDQSEVIRAEIQIGTNTATVKYQLRGEKRFRVNVPKDSIATLLQKFKEQGVTVYVAEGPDRDFKSTLVTLAPLIVIALLWIFMLRQMRGRGRPGSRT